MFWERAPTEAEILAAVRALRLEVQNGDHFLLGSNEASNRSIRKELRRRGIKSKAIDAGIERANLDAEFEKSACIGAATTTILVTAGMELSGAMGPEERGPLAALCLKHVALAASVCGDADPRVQRLFAAMQTEGVLATVSVLERTEADVKAALKAYLTNG